MSVLATEAPVTENPNPFKLSDYAFQRIKNVTAGASLIILKDKTNGERIIEFIDKTVDHWDDEEHINNMMDSYKEVLQIATAQGDIDTILGIEKITDEISQKLKSVTEFKSRLRGGKDLGPLIGAELLYLVDCRPELLDDPIILTGADFVLEVLGEKQKDEASTTSRGEWPSEFNAFAGGTAAAVKEISEFRDKVKHRQESNKSSIQNPNGKV